MATQQSPTAVKLSPKVVQSQSPAEVGQGLFKESISKHLIYSPKNIGESDVAESQIKEHLQEVDADETMRSPPRLGLFNPKRPIRNIELSFGEPFTSGKKQKPTEQPKDPPQEEQKKEWSVHDVD